MGRISIESFRAAEESNAGGGPKNAPSSLCVRPGRTARPVAHHSTQPFHMANSVQELEALLTEFYSAITPERRTQIGSLSGRRLLSETAWLTLFRLEARLNVVRLDPQSWSYVQPILSGPASEKLVHFASSILDCHFAGRWKLIPIDSRTQLRDFISGFLMQHLSVRFDSLVGCFARSLIVLALLVQNLSHAVLHRLVKVVVSIAAHDWPKRWPQFLGSVASLCQVPCCCFKRIVFVTF